VCASCARPNDADARFCSGCGLPLAGNATAPRAAEERAPREYTPKHLADKILTSRSALEGERKQVSVLFADVKGSMELAEQTDPEEWHTILDRFFEILASGIQRFEGTVNQYTGDGIMALFGAPIAHEDHAERACHAALWLGEELRLYANEVRRDYGLSFSVRMGINSGEVVVGKIGDDLRMDYTAQGHTVGLAARVEQLAEPGRIYLAEASAALVRDFFDLEDLGPFRIPGARDPVPVYALRGAGKLRTRLARSQARGFSRFVGRDREMRLLEEALEETLAGRGGCVAICGEAGVGKSRLAHEILLRARAQGLRCAVGQALPHGASVPLHASLSILRSLFGIGERDPDLSAREKITGRLLMLDAAFADDLPLVFDFLGVADPEHPLPAMDPETYQRRLIEFTEHMARVRSRREPLVALMEDLHWLDAASEAHQKRMCAGARESRALYMMTFRPEYEAGWLADIGARSLPLRPLDGEAIDALLRDLLGGDPSLDALAAEVRKRTAGNPFFIEEVVHDLAERGVLQGPRGERRLEGPEGPAQPIAIPASVQAVLAARIDRLRPGDKDLLQTAAVVGQSVPDRLLAALWSAPDAEREASLARLVAADLLFEEVEETGSVHHFRHPLTREVAYDSQLGGRKRRIHAQVAHAYESIHADSLDDRAALIAYHWEEAAEPLTASKWSYRAARRAEFSSDEAALRHLGHVRDLLRPLAESEETAVLMAEACARTLRSTMRGGGIDEQRATACYREGLEAAERARAPRLVAAVEMGCASALGMGRGRVDDWLEHGRAGYRAAVESGDRAIQAEAAAAVAIALLYRGRLREVLEFADEVLPGMPLDPSFADEFWGFGSVLYLRGMKVMALTFMGQPAAGVEYASSVLLEIGRPQMVALSTRLQAHLFLGEPEAAAALLPEITARAAVDRSSALGRVMTQFDCAMVYVAQAEWERAADAVEPALSSLSESHVGGALEPRVLAIAARTDAGTGSFDRALERARRAVALAVERQTAIWEPECRLALAGILLEHRGKPAAPEIESALANALQVALETGARAYLGEIHERRATLARLRGDEADRIQELREAQRLYDAMGAAAHAERIVGELAP
jgi:class 3 adenylate cyclase/tetratricopeptide (TPR) repeat protein